MFRTSEDYEHFAFYLRARPRYVLDQWRHDFVETVVETSKKRITTLNANYVLWRAALGCVNPKGVHPHDVFFTDEIGPHPIERMKPLRDRAHEGRVNPRGIPCLYTATDAETAMTETRPWAGSIITVSQLLLVKDVALVDCTQATDFDLMGPKTQERLESNNWYVLNEAFSLPVFQAEDTADYAPTQYLAEAFKAAGYDGLIYASQVGPGKNVALFDTGAAEIASRQLRHAEKPSFRFGKIADPMYEDELRNLLPSDE